MSTVAVEQALGLEPEQVGSALLAISEGQWFDRKSSRIDGRELANSLIAFANAEGGVVAIGMHQGRIEGVHENNRLTNSQMQAHIDFCHPPVRARSRMVPCIADSREESHLLVIDVEPSDQVHATSRDEVYLRVGDENRRLTFSQRRELMFDKGQASFESEVAQGCSLEDMDDELLEQYVAAVRAPDGIRLLRARGLAVSKELTVAGCLLFAREPQRLYPEATVRVLRYRGSERGSGARQQLLEDIKIDGPIPRQLITARDEIERLQPVRRALRASGTFGSVPLVPGDAWLEGVVNAVVHRSYSVAGDHIRIEIFDDRIEIHSPGRFPGLVDPDDPLETTRFARNPRIARVAADLNFGQELGEGIRRMFEEMRAAGLSDPIYRQTSGSVELTLSAELVDRALEERLPENARAITSALREAQRLSTGEIAEVLGVSRPVARRDLEQLQSAGVIEWVGKSARDPRAYWRMAAT